MSEKIYTATSDNVKNQLLKLGFSNSDVKLLDQNFLILEMKDKPSENPNLPIIQKCILTFQSFDKDSKPEVIEKEVENRNITAQMFLDNFIEERKSAGTFFKGIYGVAIVENGKIITQKKIEVGYSGIKEL